MSRKLLLPYRQRVIGGAAGRVLEIGIGSGLNLPLYGDAVEEVIGIDVSPELLAMAERAAQRHHLRVRLLEGSAVHLPSTIADKSVDTVVVTWGDSQPPAFPAALRFEFDCRYGIDLPCSTRLLPMPVELNGDACSPHTAVVWDTR
jgi:SAM-dependent methyltransferase